MAAQSMQEQLIDVAYEVREEYKTLLEKRTANRETLRNLAKQGLLTDEQIAEVNELYPERVRKDEDSEPGEDNATAGAASAAAA